MEKQKGNFVVDAHCHLELFDDPGAAMEASERNGLAAAITSGWSAKSNAMASDLTRIANVFATIGIGPEGTKLSDGIIENLEEMKKSNRKIIGIGEIGLDTKACENLSMRDQEELFSAQLDLAQKMRIPAVIHSRGTFGECLEALEEKGIEKAMFHFFGGDEEDARRVEKLGYIISLPPLDSSRLKRVIRAVDTESIVTETDAPLVGKLPYDAARTVEKIAGLKSKRFEEIGLIIMQTIKDYFDIIISEGP